MMMRKWTRHLALAAVVALGAGCDEDPTEPDPADSIVAMRLVIGTQTVNIDLGGNVTGGPVTIPAGGATITGTFLDINGQAVTVPTNEFELRVTSSNTARLTFARTSNFAGTLTRVSAGPVVLSVSLWHTVENHPDFGPFDVAVTVQ